MILEASAGRECSGMVGCLDVPKGVTHGFQLRSGDEIHLGDARIVVLRDRELALRQMRGRMGIERTRMPRGVVNRVRERRRNSHDRCFARSCRGRSLRSRSTISIFGMSVNRGTRYFESRGLRIRPFSKSMPRKRSANPHHNGAFDLVFQMFGINDGATLKSFDNPLNPEFARGTH